MLIGQFRERPMQSMEGNSFRELKNSLQWTKSQDFQIVKERSFYLPEIPLTAFAVKQWKKWVKKDIFKQNCWSLTDMKT